MRQSFRRQNSHHRSVRFCSYPTVAHFTGAKGHRVSFCDIDFGLLRCVHRDRPDRDWDHALRAILRGQQSDMVNAIEQGNDGPHGARILDGGKRASNCFTVIQSTSTAGTSESRKRTHRRCRACFSKCSARGYCASSSRRTTSVTESPRYARQRRLFRRRRPAPRTACAIGALIRLLLLCGTRSNSPYAAKLGTKINFLFTNSSMPRLESSFPYPERLMPPKGSSGRLISG